MRHRATLIAGVEGMALYINDHRIGGGLPATPEPAPPPEGT